MRENIGTLECPICGYPDAAVRESVKAKAYLVCDECGFQGFARGQDSNRHLRTKMKPVAAAVAAVFVKPAPIDVQPQPAPTPKPKKKGMWDGIWPED